MIKWIIRFFEKLPNFRGRNRILWILAGFFPRGAYYSTTLDGPIKIQLAIRSPYERCIWLKMRKIKELDALRNLLKEGDVFLDIGSNIGLWALTAAQKVGAGGKVFSIEANPAIFRRLQTNIKLNAFDQRIDCYNVGASEQNGELPFLIREEHYISAIVREGVNQSTRIKVAPLDEVLGSVLSQLDGVKIDVEGHEGPVLLGFLKTFKRFRPWVVVEFNRGFIGELPFEEWIIYKELTSLGYKAYRWEDFHRERRLLTESDTREGVTCIDVLFLPENSF